MKALMIKIAFSATINKPMGPKSSSIGGEAGKLGKKPGVTGKIGRAVSGAAKLHNSMMPVK